MRVWDVRTGDLVRLLRGHDPGLILMVDYNPHSGSIASASEDRTVKVWDAATGNLLHTLAADRQAVWSVRFSPDGRTIVSGSDDETIRVWDLATSECQRAYKAPAPYLAMNISGVTGLSAAAIDSLKTLGAIVAA